MCNQVYIGAGLCLSTVAVLVNSARAAAGRAAHGKEAFVNTGGNRVGTLAVKATEDAAIVTVHARSASFAARALFKTESSEGTAAASGRTARARL
ncbi:uncharacterized protein LY79DRAFT_574345, partial [Colletotrichum navitas]